MNIMSETKKPLIGVIGGNECSSEEYQMAEKVGACISKEKAVLVCGGMGGVMEAACKGASEAGGLTVGILPSDSTVDANRYVQIPIATGMGIGRNILIIRTVQSLIAINGKFGTLSEIAFAMQLNKPVFALHPWIDVPGVEVVQSPKQAVEKAIHIFQNGI